MVWRQKENPLGQLIPLFASDQVITNSLQLSTYEADGGLDRGKPQGVVFPKTTEDVVHLVRWANEHGTPLIARGAGTGLSGGAIAEHGGVIVEFSRMKRVIEFDDVGRRIVVEPGVVNLVLTERVNAKGLYYPPDPSSGRAATIGGNIAENAGGPHCFKYGVTTNYVTGLQVVLADGHVVQLGGQALDYPEYDFLGVMTGNEGTLGIVTQATLRLIRNVPAVQTLMVAFDALEEAGRAVSAIIAHGLVPATLEMMDQQIMRILEDYTHAGLPVDAAAALIVEVDGYAESLAPQMEEIIAILHQYAARGLRVAQTAEERNQIWYARKSVGGALARIAPAYYPVDGTVPRSKIAETLRAINDLCAGLGLPVAYVLHAGDGNFHPHIFIANPSDPALMARALDAVKQVMNICVKQSGSITGEHGVGTEKRVGMPLMFTADELAAMQDVKKLFDPKNLLNPGKIFPANLPEPPPLPVPGKSPASPFAPTTVEQAAEAIRAWSAESPKKNVCIRGAGDQSRLPSSTEMVLSTHALQGITMYAPEDLYVTVGSGTRLASLQTELARDGMWVPLVSPWQDATVGGMVAANANAPLRMRYGGVRDQVLAATVALPNGRVIRAGRPVVKNVAGYDLVKLFVGSHGTLGLIGDVTFRMAPLPRARRSLIVPIMDLGHGLGLATRLLHVCLVASAVMICRDCDLPDCSSPYVLIYTAEGLDEEVTVELSEVREVLQTENISAITQSEIAGSTVWAEWMRATPSSQIALRAGVAPKDLPQLVSNLKIQPDSQFVADIGNGHLYLRDVPDIWAVRRCVRDVNGYAVVLNAPPNTQGALDVWGYAPDSLDWMRALKACWDPNGLFNPSAFIV